MFSSFLGVLRFSRVWGICVVSADFLKIVSKSYQRHLDGPLDGLGRSRCESTTSSRCESTTSKSETVVEEERLGGMTEELKNPHHPQGGVFFGGFWCFLLYLKI